MLVLSRKIGEKIMIGSSVSVTVLSFDRGVIRLGIEAPKSVPVHRQEIYEKIIDMNRQAAKTEINALKSAMTNSQIKLKPVLNKKSGDAKFMIAPQEQSREND